MGLVRRVGSAAQDSVALELTPPFWQASKRSQRRVSQPSKISGTLIPDAWNCWSIGAPAKSPHAKMSLPTCVPFSCRLPPFGRKLINYARAVPKFSISLDVESEEALPIGVKLLVGVQIGVEPSLAPIVTRKGRLVYHALVLVTTSDGEYIEYGLSMISATFTMLIL